MKKKLKEFVLDFRHKVFGSFTFKEKGIDNILKNDNYPDLTIDLS